MKKNWKSYLSFLLVGILLFSLAGLVSAKGVEPQDVPKDHWAYQSVKKLLAKGYLELYQDQTFQGEEPVDRYTLAMVVAKLLKEFSGGQVLTSKKDLALLRKLTTEFRKELVEINSKGGTYNKRIARLEKQNAILKEDITQTQADLQQENELLQAEINQLKAANKKQTLYILAAIALGIFGAFGSK